MRCLVVATALLLVALLPARSQPARIYRTMTESQAKAVVRTYGATIGAVVGADAEKTETLVGRLACENSRGEFARDGRFYVSGHWQMPLSEDQQAGTLARLRDIWAAQSFKIKRFKMFNAIEGMIIAENPHDEVELLVESTRPPTAVAVVILTPCYRPPVSSPQPSPG